MIGRAPQALPAVVVCAAVACRAAPPRGPEAVGCEPASGTLEAGARWGDAPGTYAITMVATAGPRSGRRARGELRLVTQRVELQVVATARGTGAVRQPAIGSLELPLADVGAESVGDPRSADPLSPGVGLYVQWNTDSTVAAAVLRVGADANRRDEIRFDGGYTALHVRRFTATGFWGDWLSGGRPDATESRGHFCAVRVG